MLCMAEGGTVTPVVSKDEVKLRGLHNIENLLAAIAAVTFAAVWLWQRRPAYRRNWMEYFDHIISGGIRYQLVSFVTVIVVVVGVCILLAIWSDC